MMFTGNPHRPTPGRFSDPVASRRAFMIACLGGAAAAGCARLDRIESPFSTGDRRPSLRAPRLACDSHIHILDPRFPVTEGWRGEPVNEATVSAYRRFQARIGTERTVIVTPSTYGTDNRATLDALDQFGPSARGVVVIDCDAPPPDLDALADQGVCGIRVNFVSPQPWGTSDQRRLVATARIAADLGWHVQVYARADQLAAMAPTLAALPCDLVIDHLGFIDPSEGVAAEGHAVILGLLARGRTWVKLSGAYISSRSGAPSYADLLSIARSYVEAAPDRLVWGSDWPHRGQAGNLPDDAALLDLLLQWAADPADQRRILVDNPAALYGFA